MNVKHAQIPDNVSKILLSANFVEDMLSLGKPGSLPAKDFKECDKVLKLLGFSWNRKRGGHVKDGSDARSVIEQACQAGSVVDEKKTFQFYPTDPEAATNMVSLLHRFIGVELDNGKSPVILEPSAGAGALILALRESDSHARVVAVELDPRHADALSKFENCELHQADFLTWRSDELFDGILANPPYTANQDIRHVAAMLGLLAKGGVLVVALPANILQRSNKEAQALRARIGVGEGETDREFQLLHEELYGRHKASGSGALTSILVIRRSA